jgi:dCTP deaminase
MDGILSDAEILRAMSLGDIAITPFDATRLNPVSVDLTLGDDVAVYTEWVQRNPSTVPENGSHFYPRPEVADVKVEQTVEHFKIDEKRGWVLKPGIGYLMHVRERVHTKRYVPVLDGKSSIGRLFIQVHATAGFGDPGFDGQFTLEVIVQHPVRVYIGMPIAQVRFQSILGSVSRLYDGNYTGAGSTGAVPSKIYKAFR